MSNMSAASISKKFMVECKAAEEFINNSTQSTPGYDACMQPFMMKNEDHKAQIGFNTPAVVEKLNKIPLPFKLQVLFKVIGATNIETYHNNWTLLSLDKIEKMYNHCLEKNQKRSVNFAMFYAGMGYACMASYDPDTDKIYYKMENGPNGYEAEDNYNKAIKYVPLEKDLHDITHWFKLIEKQNLDICEVPLYSA